MAGRNSNSDDSAIIIIKKKKGGHGGHHGGAWKVAYADFVTAMMALFIVLWIVGQSKGVKEGISEYFKDPVAFQQKVNAGSGLLPGGKAFQEIQKKAPPPPPKPETKKDPVSEIEHLKAEGKKLEGMIAGVPSFDKFKDRIQVVVTNEGLRIELIESAEGLFFDVGSAKLKAETVSLLKLIGAELGKLPNSIIIEGYTDARPFGTANYTNWELSADRANIARRIMEDNGLRSDQVLQVRGFADRKLKNPNDPLDSANRRVSIFLVPSAPIQAQAPSPAPAAPAGTAPVAPAPTAPAAPASKAAPDHGAHPKK
jgi:chemotaxis protein MotB